MRNHEHVNHKLRATFVQYFFKVGRKFKLKRNTIFLAVYYMDAYFSRNLKTDKK